MHVRTQGFLCQAFNSALSLITNLGKSSDLSADLALINANVRTMNPSQPVAEAVAISKNKIAKVGTNQEINQLIGKDTRVISLNGKTVLPGLIDTHIHVADFGRCLLWLDLTSAGSIKELQSLLKERAKKTPAGKWIVGRGWNQNRFKEKRPPKLSDLNSAAPDNPVILYHESAMICAVNSKALELAGVSKQTVTPLDGTIEKYPATGELTGILRGSATNLVWKAVPEPTEDELLEATALACQKIAEAGLTSVHWLVLAENELSIIQKLHEEGRLPLRVNVIIPEVLLEKTVDFKTIDNSMLRVGGAVIAVDGYLASKTAALFQPYSDEPAKNGSLLCMQEAMKASVARILAAGFQPVIHAMGDKAVDAALKVIEQSSKRQLGKAVRFRIEQAAVLNKELIEHLRTQKVIVSVQPRVIASEFSVWSATEHLGVERARWLYPLKTLLEEGVRVVGGSDCPMEPLNPLLGMQEAMMREEFSEQRISVEEALRMYTVDAAYSSGEENVKGSIGEGKLADLTILTCDPLMIQQKKIKDINIEMAIIDGRVVYSKP